MDGGLLPSAQSQKNRIESQRLLQVNLLLSFVACVKVLESPLPLRFSR